MSAVNDKIGHSLSLEIDEVKSHANYSKLRVDMDDSEQEIPLNGLEKLTEVDDNAYLKAAFFMVLATLSWTAMHISMKIIYARSPEITGFDTTAFIGYFLMPFYYIAGKISKKDMNMFNLPTKVSSVLVGRLIVGVSLNV